MTSLVMGLLIGGGGILVGGLLWAVFKLLK